MLFNVSCSGNITKWRLQECLTLSSAQGSAWTTMIRRAMVSLAEYRQGGSGACLEGDNCVA